MLTGLLLPTLVLMAIAVFLTRVLERMVPETPFGLAMLAVFGSAAAWFSASLIFAGLYAHQDARVLPVLGDANGIVHLVALGAKAALIWAPLVLLVTVTAPRRWKTARW